MCKWLLRFHQMLPFNRISSQVHNFCPYKRCFEQPGCYWRPGWAWTSSRALSGFDSMNTSLLEQPFGTPNKIHVPWVWRTWWRHSHLQCFVWCHCIGKMVWSTTNPTHLVKLSWMSWVSHWQEQNSNTNKSKWMKSWGQPSTNFDTTNYSFQLSTAKRTFTRPTNCIWHLFDYQMCISKVGGQRLWHQLAIKLAWAMPSISQKKMTQDVLQTRLNIFTKECSGLLHPSVLARWRNLKIFQSPLKLKWTEQLFAKFTRMSSGKKGKGLTLCSIKCIWVWPELKSMPRTDWYPPNQPSP